MGGKFDPVPIDGLGKRLNHQKGVPKMTGKPAPGQVTRQHPDLVIKADSQQRTVLKKGELSSTMKVTFQGDVLN